MRVYIVFGTTGEYSDRTEWPVRAFLSENEAAQLVAALDERVRIERMDGSGFGPGYYERLDEVTERMKDVDPNFQTDYTGTRYYVVDVPLVGADETVATVVEQERTRHRRMIGGLEF